ncbi:MAG: hypothetical protein ACRER0_04495 [Gammaproteobacteria bacterium]
MDIANYSKKLLAGLALGSVALLAACVVRPVPQQPQVALTAAPTSGTCSNCGVITSIQSVSASDYRVIIRMDSGTTQTLDQAHQPAFRVGDHVQILNRTPPPPR